MGTFSPAFERPSRTAALIKAEDEALVTAHNIASMLHRPAPEYAEVQQESILEALSRSGLLGISIPTEYGGIDVSNTVLADICTALAEAGLWLGETIAAHYSALELLRSYGSEPQRAYFFAGALTGLRFAKVLSIENNGSASPPVSSPNGLGWNLAGSGIATPAANSADWLLVSTGQREPDAPVLYLLPGQTNGLVHVANSGATPGSPSDGDNVLFRDVQIEADGRIQSRRTTDKPDVPQSLDLLLQGALHLGVGKRHMNIAIALAEARRANVASDEQYPASLEIGNVSVRLTATEAIVEKAAKALDAAQIGAADDHRRTALFVATAAEVTAFEAAGIARNVLAAFEQRGRDQWTVPTDREPTSLSAKPIESLLRETGAHRLKEVRPQAPYE